MKVWVAVDSDGEVNIYQKRPVWDADRSDGEWLFNDDDDTFFTFCIPLGVRKSWAGRCWTVDISPSKPKAKKRRAKR